jgi:hypothetical protein
MSNNKFVRVMLILVGVALAVGIVVLGKNWLWSHAMKAYNSPPEVRIINRSNADLRDFTLEGRGFHESIDVIPSNSKAAIEVKPAGESSLKIEFNANSRHFMDDDLAYIEPRGGYWVKLTVLEDFSVDADGGFRIFR